MLHRQHIFFNLTEIFKISLTNQKSFAIIISETYQTEKEKLRGYVFRFVKTLCWLKRLVKKVFLKKFKEKT